MTLVVHVASEGVRIPVAARRLAGLARRVLRSEGIANAMLSIAFISNSAMAALNRRHLGRKGSTDVIAFGLSSTGDSGPVVGDIYIAPAVARANAQRLGLSIREEMARLVVHGTLHVLGYVHPVSDARLDSAMWRKQELLLRRGIPRARGK